MFGPGLPGLFLVPVSFGPGTFNEQDPPLLRMTEKRRELTYCQVVELNYPLTISQE
ncbi:hypothetical protein HanIR_Chr10g0491691 [Helianthus annuus]|nr:hypothetical protein HanIR_Chr10g0491691 [Helianthus annuus]